MPLKTLIVDDEPIARKVLREELELMEDVEVIGEAADGAAALEKIGADQPDLVLLDLQMPSMGGARDGAPIEARETLARDRCGDGIR